MNNSNSAVTRRAFLIDTFATAAVGGLAHRRAEASVQGGAAAPPWYRRAYLWGQTNITEKDPVRYDIGWWRGYWKRTGTQAVIINAGGVDAGIAG